MEVCLRPQGYMKVLQNNNQKSDNKKKKNESKIKRYSRKPLGLYLSIFDSFHFAICLMIVVL